MAGMGVMAIFVAILFLAIGVAISRWVFRVNDIVKRLDKIIELLTSQKGDVK